MNDAVALTDGGLGQVFVHEFDGVRVQQRLCGGVGHVEAAVVVECGADAESPAAAEVPRPLRGWFAVDYDRAAHGAHGSCIEVNRAVVVFPGRDGRGNDGMAKEVQGEFYFRYQAVPQEFGKGIRYSRQNGEEVCFECADGPLGNVAAVDIWWDKLELGFPFIFDLEFVGGAAIVVENLQVDDVASLGKFGHDSIGSG